MEVEEKPPARRAEERMTFAMRVSWWIGRVAGIDVFLHPTFLFLLAYFGIEGGPTMLILGTSAFVCVFLHELGHALAAKAFGIGTATSPCTRSAVSRRLERMPKAPGAELAIAVAGPAVNVALAILLAATVFLADALPYSPAGEAAVFATRLAVINLLLAAFNMIPAFPMDGGRVVRAPLSGWLGRLRATEAAVAIGRLLAGAFAVFSLIYTHNLMHVLLAVFVYVMAGLELRQVRGVLGRTPASFFSDRRRLDRAAGLPLGQSRRRRLATRADRHPHDQSLSESLLAMIRERLHFNSSLGKKGPRAGC